MEIQQKVALREVVERYLEDLYPSMMEEFQVVFNDVYETIDRKLLEEPEAERKDQSGLAFETGLISGTIISIACWITVKFLIAATKVTAREKIPSVFDQVEEKLLSWHCNPKMVHDLRERIQKYLLEAFS